MTPAELRDLLLRLDMQQVNARQIAHELKQSLADYQQGQGVSPLTRQLLAAAYHRANEASRFSAETMKTIGLILSSARHAGDPVAELAACVAECCGPVD